MNSLIKSIFIGLIFSFINVYANETKYPDVWYRLYDWPTNVCDMFYTDSNVWKNEPVILLCQEEKHDGRHAVAEGYFSKKQRPVLIIPDKKDVNKCIYIDEKTKKILVQKAYLGKTAWNSRMEAVRKIREKYYFNNEAHDSCFQWKQFDDSFHGDWSVFGISECEPIPDSIKLEDLNHTLLWEKSIIRYYRSDDVIPTVSYKTCEYAHQITSQGGGILSLILPDNTIIVSNYPYTFVVRIKLLDGESKQLPNNLKVINYTDVLKAKQRFKLYLKNNLGSFKYTVNHPEIVENMYRKFTDDFFNNNQGVE